MNRRSFFGFLSAIPTFFLVKEAEAAPPVPWEVTWNGVPVPVPTTITLPKFPKLEAGEVCIYDVGGGGICRLHANGDVTILMPGETANFVLKSEGEHTFWERRP